MLLTKKGRDFMTRSKIKMYIRSYLWHRHSVRNNVTMNLLISTFVTITGPITTVFGLLVPECFIHPVVSVSALPWFNIYIYIYSNYRTSDVLTIFIDSNNRTSDVLTIFIDSNNRTSDVLTIIIDSNNRTSNVLTKHVNLVLVVESPLSNMT